MAQQVTQALQTNSGDGKIRVPAPVLGAQLRAIFSAWGIPTEQAETTLRIMVATDLRGIDSHGIGMLPLYDELRTAGKLVMAPELRRVRETPVTALIDAGGGLGHYASAHAMQLAIEKCRTSGLAAVAVRNSNHFGAAGIYALMAADADLIGLTTSNVWKRSVVPTRAREAMFGTNPIAFAAPARRNPPFCLDMATSTVAIGKLRVAWLEGRDIPEGWATDTAGRPLCDSGEAFALRLLTPLGGTAEMSSHKGYGLAAMVEILSALLPGARAAVLGDKHDQDPERLDVGHFFCAVDPAAFRDVEDFKDEMDELIDTLRASHPTNSAEPVLVHGDPETAAEQERQAEGIPVAPKLASMIREIAAGCGVDYLLQERSS